jgi:spore coat protein I
MIDICKQAIDAINKSDYGLLAADGSESVVLCHQDYGRGNALLFNGQVFVLDLDGVTFDLPARDLRKLIGKNAENRGSWHSETISDILGWYEEINPLNNKEKEVLYIDMLFPHWFYGLVKNLFKGGKTLKPSEIEKIAKLEESKVALLKNLIDEEKII